MKKTILCSALLALIGTQVYAEPGVTVTTPTANTATNPPATAPVPTTNTTLPVTPQAQPAQAALPEINCDYKIPAQTKTVDPTLVLTWSEKAVMQAFSFDPTSLDAQIQKLQACFTEQGWTGFNTALQKSGNIEAIKSQSLRVTSQIDGHASVIDTKDNQWKLTLPLTVVYQNDKEKVSQLLSIDLTVTRKPSGDLGIIQMIATPRGTVTTKKPQEPAADPQQTSLDTRPGDTPDSPPVIVKP